jgi:ubiquinone/menaquinone biosynthesis C-methylase UbiE
MNLFKQFSNLFRSGLKFDQYYRHLNEALRRYNDEYTMLHYPYFKDESDSLLQGQKNLTDYCISLLKPLNGKEVLEIGCGNGTQCHYINEKCNPLNITGVDLDPTNIGIANAEKDRRNLKNTCFYLGDAQALTMINDKSVDVVFNVESAFHYPDKESFLHHVHRVLKPGGQFVITDILTKKGKGTGIRKMWKRSMKINNWQKCQYDKGLAAANLKVEHTEDITGDVIRAFKNWPNWFRQMKKQNFLNDSLFKFYYRIYLAWTLFLLRNRREYYVFAGIRPK